MITWGSKQPGLIDKMCWRFKNSTPLPNEESHSGYGHLLDTVYSKHVRNVLDVDGKLK